MNHKVSKKIDGKWKSFGNVKENQYGNLSLGLRCTADFKKLVADMEEGKWLNFALFEEDEKQAEQSMQGSSRPSPVLNDEIPFAPCK